MNILVSIPIQESQKYLLEQKAQGALFTYSLAEQVTKEEIDNAHIILGNVPVEMLQGAKQLQWMQLYSAGTDGYCEKGVLAPGTILTNATGAFGISIAEYMLGALLMLMKNLHLYYVNQLHNKWIQGKEATTLSGKRVLIIGLGDIGREFAIRMKLLGCHITGIRKTKAEQPDYVDEQYQTEKLEEQLPKADIVALCLPGNQETHRIINEKRIKSMKSTSILMNVGRGRAIDIDALTAALYGYKIAGAILDVTDPEPLLSDHPLWKAPGVFITPHISGSSFQEDTLEKIVEITASNLEHFLAGRDLINVVDFESGYAKKS